MTDRIQRLKVTVAPDTQFNYDGELHPAATTLEVDTARADVLSALARGWLIEDPDQKKTTATKAAPKQ